MKPFINWLTSSQRIIELNLILWLTMLGAVFDNPDHKDLLPIAIAGITLAALAEHITNKRRRAHSKAPAS